MASQLFTFCLLILAFSCGKKIENSTPEQGPNPNDELENSISTSEITDKLRAFKKDYIEHVLVKADYQQKKQFELELSSLNAINSNSSDMIINLSAINEIGIRIFANAMDDYNSFGAFKTPDKEEFAWERDTICSKGSLPRVIMNEKGGMVGRSSYTIDPFDSEQCHNELKTTEKLIESISSYNNLIRAKRDFRFFLGMEIKKLSENELFKLRVSTLANGTLPAYYTIPFLDDFNLILNLYQAYEKDLSRFVRINETVGSLTYVSSAHLGISRICNQYLGKIEAMVSNNRLSHFTKVLQQFRVLVSKQSTANIYF